MAEEHPLRKALYRRSGGQCECRFEECGAHEGKRRCLNSLNSDSWKSYKRIKRSADSLRNLVAVCPVCWSELTRPRL